MEISDSVANDLIRSWRILRLKTGHHALGFPTTNILHPTHGVGTARPVPGHRESDAEMVQRLVDKMTDEMRAAFEAYHLAIIDEERCPDLSHKERAKKLDVSRWTYNRRVYAATEFVREGCRLHQKRVPSREMQN